MNEAKDCLKESILSVQKSDHVSLDASVSIQDTQMTNNVNTELSDLSETMMASLSHHSNSVMSSQGPLIITDVFPSGNLMMSDENLRRNSILKDGLREEIEGEKNNEQNIATNYNIKVEGNAMQNENYSPTSKSNQTFTIDQSVLQNISDSDADLQQITFNDGDQITQFHIQLPLSISDVQSMSGINKNVFFSQAALQEEESKALAVENIPTENNSRSTFLIHSNSQENSNIKSSTSKEDSSDKHYIRGFSTEDTISSAIKPETGVSSSQRLLASAFGRNPIKSETFPATVNASSEIESNTNGTYSQIVYVQVDNSSQQLIPISVAAASNSAIKRSAEKCDENEKEGAPRKRKQSRRTRLPTLLPKDVPNSVDKLRSLAPRLLSYPLYAGAQASIGAGKSLLKAYDITAINVNENGEYFEILGRCTQCFRFSRTTSYCRAEKNHREPKSSVCFECELNGLSTVVCRRKLNHSVPNAQPLNIVINTALQNIDHVKQLCVRNMLPPCFAELHSIVVHHADITFVAQRNKDNQEESTTEETLPFIPRKATDYARGYLHPYSKEKWDEWLGRFCEQTGTTFRIRTGKRVNKKTDHGLANHNGRIVSYRTLETQLYNCSLGGKPRKRKPKDVTKKRKERGSRLMGCPAVIHTRLLETELAWRSLEVTVPKISSHLSCHEPRLVPENVFAYDDVIMSNMDPSQLQQENDELASHHQQTSTVLQHQSEDSLALDQEGGELNVHEATNQMELPKLDDNITELKNNSKTILLTCVSLLDSLNSSDSLHCLETSAHHMLSYIVKEAHKQQTLPLTLKKPKSSTVNVMDIDLTSPTQLETVVE